jgi:hypothetical protein
MLEEDQWPTPLLMNYSESQLSAHQRLEPPGYRMKVFLAGVSDVGKIAIGVCLAKRPGCVFHDPDTDIENRFSKPLAQLRAEAMTPRSFRNGRMAALSKHVLTNVGCG